MGAAQTLYIVEGCIIKIGKMPATILGKRCVANILRFISAPVTWDDLIDYRLHCYQLRIFLKSYSSGLATNAFAAS